MGERVAKYSEKTFIGRIAKGFYFLGYSFEPKGLSVAPKTLEYFLERIIQEPKSFMTYN